MTKLGYIILRPKRTWQVRQNSWYTAPVLSHISKLEGRRTKIRDSSLQNGKTVCSIWKMFKHHSHYKSTETDYWSSGRTKLKRETKRSVCPTHKKNKRARLKWEGRVTWCELAASETSSFLTQSELFPFYYLKLRSLLSKQTPLQQEGERVRKDSRV